MDSEGWQEALPGGEEVPLLSTPLGPEGVQQLDPEGGQESLAGSE